MNPSSPRPLRMAIGGIHIESSTFSPLLSRISDFTVTRGDDLLARYPFLSATDLTHIEPVPLVHFRALPGGRIDHADYQQMKEEILSRLREAGEIDAFFFDVHGAMAVDGLNDAEADLLAAIREETGPSLPITCCQDLHGNVSDRLISQVDWISTYRTAPHIDWMETRERAVRMLAKWWLNPVPIFRAHVGIPVLVSGEMSSTECEPGRSLYAPLQAESELPGVWDASLWVGYAWADEARSMATAVVTGTDPDAVKSTACQIAQRYWDARGDFEFISPAGSAEWCLEQAIEHGGPAVFLSDAGDNPTAGAAGDVTHSLAALLAHPAFVNAHSAIFASIPDPAAIAQCVAAGIGAEVSLSLGGKLDPHHGGPVEITGCVQCLTADDAMGGTHAVVRIGQVHIIITERRKPFHKRSDFLALGLDPLKHTLTIVKIGYLEPELKAMATMHRLILSPGAVQPQLTAIPYQNLTRPIFPLEKDFSWQPSPQLSSSHPTQRNHNNPDSA